MNSVALHLNYERCKTLLAEIIFGNKDSKLIGNIYDLLELLNDLEDDAKKTKEECADLKMQIKEQGYIINDMNIQMEFMQKRLDGFTKNKEAVNEQIGERN